MFFIIRRPQERSHLGTGDQVSIDNARAMIDARIARLRSGNFGDSKPIGGGASENRIHYGPGYRIYYGVDGKDVILLLYGGDKSSQDADIKLAQQYWDDYKKTRKTKKKA